MTSVFDLIVYTRIIYNNRDSIMHVVNNVYHYGNRIYTYYQIYKSSNRVDNSIELDSLSKNT